MGVGGVSDSVSVGGCSCVWAGGMPMYTCIHTWLGVHMGAYVADVKGHELQREMHIMSVFCTSPVAPPPPVDPVPPSPRPSAAEHQLPSPSAAEERSPLCTGHSTEQTGVLHEAQGVQPSSLGHPPHPEPGVSLHQFPYS